MSKLTRIWFTVLGCSLGLSGACALSTGGLPGSSSASGAASSSGGTQGSGGHGGTPVGLGGMTTASSTTSASSSGTPSCGPGMKPCGAACAPEDPAHGCSSASCVPCSTNNATEACDGSGKCTVMSCAGGYADCNHDPSDGCEVDTSTDPASCGACGATCASGFCADAVCCNQACTRACQACTAAKKGSGSDGTCGNVTDGQPSPAGHPACSMTAASTCGTDGLCHGGACESWSSATPCSAVVSCTKGMEQVATRCSGSGTCAGMPQMTACSPYVCQAGGTACLTSCGTTTGPTGDASCAPGSYCDGQGAGVCQPQKPNGAVCAAGDQCQDGNCVGNVCCAGSCNGPCDTGTCTAGSCDVQPPDHGCAAGNCVGGGGNTLHGLGVCDGTTGTCQVNSDFNCQSAATCTTTGCSQCNNDNECSHYACCNMSTNSCVAQGLLGTACSAGDQCVSGHCNGAGGTCSV